MSDLYAGYSHRDLIHAVKAYNAVISEVVTDKESIYLAHRAMVDADSKTAGAVAFHQVLESRADDDTRTAARLAWDESLAKSDELRAERAAAEAAAAEYGSDDTDDEFDGDDQGAEDSEDLV
jgi:hypothetical protein